jgi:hypothetical protein
VLLTVETADEATVATTVEGPTVVTVVGPTVVVVGPTLATTVVALATLTEVPIDVLATEVLATDVLPTDSVVVVVVAPPLPDALPPGPNTATFPEHAAFTAAIAPTKQIPRDHHMGRC